MQEKNRKMKSYNINKEKNIKDDIKKVAEANIRIKCTR